MKRDLKKDTEENVLVENGKSVANRPLPSVPTEFENGDYGAIVLFYQYKEPVWTKQQHKLALKKVIELGTKYNISGRGRVAPEGLNCTLSSKNPQDIRSFCYALREWDSLFEETDFKISDGIPHNKLFKSLSLRKTDELVAYGLSGEKAPSLKKFAGTHLEADEYHQAMAEKDTVIIDVRNAYESAIGSFKPPPGGAELIDPKMRNSIEFPKWINDPETQEKLNGKKVLMYCTGGIRCERASALLNQMSAVNPNLNPKGVYELRGGIERYVKTYTDGGYWGGKNYLFDRRMEQVPGTKNEKIVEEDVNSKCCLCRKKCTSYRGQFKCCQSLCGVPVIVCFDCKKDALEHPELLRCELCKEGYRAPTKMPDLVDLKQQAEAIVSKDDADVSNEGATKRQKGQDDAKKRKKRKREGGTYYPDRLFLRRLPLTVTLTKLKDAIGENLTHVEWLKDKKYDAFYGSCIVFLNSKDKDTKNLLLKKSIKIDKKKIKIEEVWMKSKAEKDPELDKASCTEYPPIGH